MNHQPILVLDVHYLCHRAFHSTPNLSFKEKPTGVIFGFLRSITQLKDDFQTDRVVFCFEHPTLFRRDVYPDYKKKRISRELSDEERIAYKNFAIQISELRKRYLPKIGFRNIFSYQGMESDDVMAAIAKHYSDENEVILVTADHDLFQCLAPNVTMYSPQTRKILTEEWFIKEYKIPPWKWAVVKALSGCQTDEVKGIKGVGELTALRYLRGELNKDSKAYQSIIARDGRGIVRRNRTLVQLPYRNCPIPEIVEDQVTKSSWLEVTKLLGMKSLASHVPIATRKLMRNESMS